MKYFILIYIFAVSINIVAKNTTSYSKNISFIERTNLLIKKYGKNRYFYKKGFLGELIERKGIKINLENYPLKNTYEMGWINKYYNYDLYIINTVVVSKTKKPILYLRIITELGDTNDYTINFKNIVFSILIKIIGYKRVIKYISNNFCHCNILDSDIKKDTYIDFKVSKSQDNYKTLLKACIEDGICEKIPIYTVEKKYIKKVDGFKVMNKLKIRFFTYGSRVDVNWVIFGKQEK